MEQSFLFSKVCSVTFAWSQRNQMLKNYPIGLKSLYCQEMCMAKINYLRLQKRPADNEYKSEERKAVASPTGSMVWGRSAALLFKIYPSDRWALLKNVALCQRHYYHHSLTDQSPGSRNIIPQWHVLGDTIICWVSAANPPHLFWPLLFKSPSGLRLKSRTEKRESWSMILARHDRWKGWFEIPPSSPALRSCFASMKFPFQLLFGVLF